MERYQFSVYLGAAAITVLVAYLVVGSTKTAAPVVVTFDEQLAEQNRQADAASQLRAAEKGFLVEMRDGKLSRVCYKDSKAIAFCAVGVESFVSNYPQNYAGYVKRVIRPTDHDWGEIAFLFLRGERTK